METQQLSGGPGNAGVHSLISSEKVAAMLAGVKSERKEKGRSLLDAGHRLRTGGSQERWDRVAESRAPVRSLGSLADPQLKSRVELHDVITTASVSSSIK